MCELAQVLQDIPQWPMPKRNWHRAGLEASGGLQEGCPPLLCLPFTHTHARAVRHMRWPRHCFSASLVHFLLLSSFLLLDPS